MTQTQNPLWLHEELILLALHDEKGTIASASGMYQYALGGAILAELLLAGRIEVEDSKKKLVHLVDPEPVGDTLIDECLGKIGHAKKPTTPQGWVMSFAGIKNLKHRVAEGLCARDILQGQQDTVLFVFSRKTYPELNPEPERELVDRLDQAIFTECEDLDARTVVLISLAHSTGLLNAVFGRKELAARKARIEQLISGEIVGEAAKGAVEAVQTALFISTIATTTAIH